MLITHTLTQGQQSFLTSSLALTASINTSLAFANETRKSLNNQSIRLYNIFYLSVEIPTRVSFVIEFIITKLF